MGIDPKLEDAMYTANEMQVGGSHYKSDYQHWDWCVDINLGYLESAATKYISRWKSKAGIQDLNKALHYMIKALEVHLEGRYRNHSFHNASTPSIRIMAKDQTTFFIEEQSQLSHVEKNLIFRIATWSAEPELEEAIDLLREFIATSIGETRPLGRTEHPAPFGYTDEEN